MISDELLEQMAIEIKDTVYYDTGISLDTDEMYFDVSGNVLAMKL